MTVQPITGKSWLPADCAAVIRKIETSLSGLNDPAAIEARLMRLIDDHERHMDRESSVGTQEVTRFRMKEAAMNEIARLMGRVMAKHEAPEKVRPDVVAFRRRYQTLGFVR